MCESGKNTEMLYGDILSNRNNGQSASKLLSHYDMEKVQRPAERRTLQADGNGNGVARVYELRYGLFLHESVRCY